jgi:methylmalonyl-CoA/ethylmalonyl-CoA epimerase
MDMENLEHIGIAVKDLEKSNALFAQLLGSEHYKIEEVISEGVRTSFFNVGGVKIELLEATHAESPIAKFIEKRGEGVHHLAFAVRDIKKSIGDYSQKGFSPLSTEPKTGADNKLICFLHPKTTNGVLIELCQEKPA